jgi:hypothetical protein
MMRSPLCLTQAWSLHSSAWSLRSSLSYSLRVNLPFPAFDFFLLMVQLTMGAVQSNSGTNRYTQVRLTKIESWRICNKADELAGASRAQSSSRAALGDGCNDRLGLRSWNVDFRRSLHRLPCLRLSPQPHNEVIEDWCQEDAE